MNEVDPERRSRQRALLWLCVAAVCWRWLLAARTPVPAEDGVNYLWMAQQFALGDAAAALSEPFAPLWSLLLALPIALGAEPFVAGQVLGCLCGGLAVLPVAALGERLARGAGPIAAALCATSSVFARTAAEVLTEPLFVLLAATATWAGCSERWWRCGLGIGAAFLVRPEGAVLLLPFAALAPRRAWRPALVLGAVIAAFGLWRQLCGHGFDPVPKLAFHGLRDDLGDARGDLVANALALPGAFFEAFAGAAVLAVIAAWPRVWHGTPPGAARVRRQLWLALGCGVAVLLTFVVRRRFFVSWGGAVWPLAAVVVARVGALVGALGGARAGRLLTELLLAAVCGADLFTGWCGTIDADRLGERLVGRHLAERVPMGRVVVSDFTRLLWFAGQRPLPPRHFDAAWYLAAAQRPEVEFVVLNERHRAVFDAVADRLGAAFARYDLPPHLRDAAQRRGIAVFVRR